MFTQLNQYHVVLEVDPTSSTDPDALNDILRAVAATGTQVPLSSASPTAEQITARRWPSTTRDSSRR